MRQKKHQSNGFVCNVCMTSSASITSRNQFIKRHFIVSFLLSLICVKVGFTNSRSWMPVLVQGHFHFTRKTVKEKFAKNSLNRIYEKSLFILFFLLHMQKRLKTRMKTDTFKIGWKVKCFENVVLLKSSLSYVDKWKMRLLKTLTKYVANTVTFICVYGYFSVDENTL